MSNHAELAGPPARVIDTELLRGWPMPVHDDGDKFARGTVAVIGGSPRTPGAARLAGEAALRMGAGRLEIVTAADVAVALGVAVPEALVVPLPAGPDGGLRWAAADDRLQRLIGGADAVLIGPGLLGDHIGDLVGGALRWVADDALVVLDAQALPALAALAEVEPEAIPRGRLILTPNHQELRNLAETDAGIDIDGDLDGEDVDECALAAAVARRYGAVVTCFGHVTSPDRCWEVPAGSPGLGTSGSGDVLAGLALGAAARCGDAAQAACWATFVHTEAGVSLGRQVGELSFLARELVGEVPAVLGAVEG